MINKKDGLKLKIQKKYFLVCFCLLVYSFGSVVAAEVKASSKGSFTYNPNAVNNVNKSQSSDNKPAASNSNKEDFTKNFEQIKKTIEMLQNQIINMEKVIETIQTVSSTETAKSVQSTQSGQSVQEVTAFPVQVVESTPSVQPIPPVQNLQPAEYNKIVFQKKEVKKIGEAYFMIIQFKPLKKTPFAEDMRFEINVPDNTNAEIKDISYAAKLKSGKATSSISDDAKSASFVCSLAGDESLAITILFSQKTIVTIKGNNGLEILTLNFEK